MNNHLPESRKNLELCFQQLHRVSLQDCAEKPGLLVRLFEQTTNRAKQNRVHRIVGDYGRGYPFNDLPRISAKEADAKNLEILSKW